MNDPQSQFMELRRWVQSTICTGHPIRDAHYRMALSASVHRLLKYGPDAVLNAYTARDILNLLPYVNGVLAEMLMRTAFSRAIVENDEVIVDHLAAGVFMPEVRLWYWKLCEALIGKCPSPNDVTAWVDGMDGESLSIARLMICRIYPDTVHSSWLQDLPDIPRLQAEICQMLALKKDYRQIVKMFLNEHPKAKYCVPQEYWARL